jgi:hypothetical protein
MEQLCSVWIINIPPTVQEEKENPDLEKNCFWDSLFVRDSYRLLDVSSGFIKFWGPRQFGIEVSDTCVFLIYVTQAARKSFEFQFYPSCGLIGLKNEEQTISPDEPLEEPRCEWRRF